MTKDQENSPQTFARYLRPVMDELLSSWLVRHAAYYGVTRSFFANGWCSGRVTFQPSTTG